MGRLFLVRHGKPEAAWGGDDADPGLSPDGKRQAAVAAGALLSMGAGAVVSSPMRRCRETAQPFESALGAIATIDPRVSEVPTPNDVADRRAWLAENFQWRGGALVHWSQLSPALHQWRAQLLRALSELPDRSAVFSHFIAINAVIGAALDRQETIVCRPNYASITEVEAAEGGVRLIHHGDEMTEGEVR